jgi:hypothetical protein
LNTFYTTVLTFSASTARIWHFDIVSRCSTARTWLPLLVHPLLCCDCRSSVHVRPAAHRVHASRAVCNCARCQLQQTTQPCATLISMFRHRNRRKQFHQHFATFLTIHLACTMLSKHVASMEVKLQIFKTSVLNGGVKVP